MNEKWGEKEKSELKKKLERNMKFSYLQISLSELSSSLNIQYFKI